MMQKEGMGKRIRKKASVDTFTTVNNSKAVKCSCNLHLLSHPWSLLPGSNKQRWVPLDIEPPPHPRGRGRGRGRDYHDRGRDGVSRDYHGDGHGDQDHMPK